MMPIATRISAALLLAVTLGATEPVLVGLDPGVVLHLAGAGGDPLPWCDDGRNLVFCLTTAARAEAVTAAVEAAGRTAQVVVVGRDRDPHLPVADQLVRAVVVEDWPAAVAAGLTTAELLRVVAPGGRIVIRSPAPADAALTALPGRSATGAWISWVRPMPAGMGEWTVDRDAEPGMTKVPPDDLDAKVTNIGSITRLAGDGYRGGSRIREPLRQPLWPRFITGNNRSRNGENRASFVVAGGRLFTTLRQDAAAVLVGDTLAKVNNVLVARDAASGLRLWSRPGVGGLVAGDDRVLLVQLGQKKIAGLDPATGVTLWTVAMNSHAPAMFPVGGGEVAVATGVPLRLDAKGAVRWQVEGKGLTGALSGDLLLVESMRAAQGRDAAVAGELRALALADGSVRWSVPATTSRQPLACADRDWVVLDDGLVVTVLAAKNGRQVLTRTRSKKSGMLARLVGGLVLISEPGDYRFQPRTEAFRLPGGEAVSDRPLELDGLGFWCCNGFGIWTRGMVLGAINGTAHPQVDPAGGYAPGGTCGTIGPVAYGTVYQPPLNCACLGFSNNLRGFLALAPPTPPATAAWTTPSAPEPGPGSGDAAPVAGGWPMFRADPARSAHAAPSAAAVGTLIPAWTAKPALAAQAGFQDLDNRQRSAFNGPITAPVVAGGVVVAGLPESRAVVAWSATDGRQRWRTVVGGAMDTPPTLTRGLALLGTHDGRVQALSLADGRPAWRTRVSPVDERMVAWGHLQDRFPATGSVVLHQGLAWTTAGLSGEIGLMLAGLDPATGTVKNWRLLPRGGYLNDCLVADATGGLWLGPIPLDKSQADLVAAAATEAYQRAVKRNGTERVHPNSFLPALRTGGLGYDPRSVPYDRLVGLGEPLPAVARTVAYDTGIRRMSKFGGTLWGQAYQGRKAILWAFADQVQVGVIQQLTTEDSKVDDLALGDEIACFTPAPLANPQDKQPPPPPRWSVATDRIWALALAGDKVLAAGPVRTDVNRDPRRNPGRLLVLNLADGKQLQELPLSAPPVQDGIAVADGLVVVTCWDGSVAAFTAR